MVEKLTRLYPARWREWYGAEMEQLLEDLAQQSRSARLRLGADLLLGAVDARLSREFRAHAGSARVIGLAARAAVIAWLPIAALIFASNVVFPSAGDAVSSVTGNLYLMAVFLVIGAVAGRACARTGTLIAAVATAGAIMAGLANATFAVIDNDFPGIVGTQPEKAAEFRASGMTSMQDFLNLSHRRALAPFRAGIRCAAGFTATSAAPGWSCALIGGLAGRIAGWSAWYSFGDPEGLVRLVPRAGRPG